MFESSDIEREWMSAAASGDVEIMRILLTTHSVLLNARLDHQTFQQLTALHLAVWQKQINVVEFLIKNGADIEVQDKTGRTALQIDIMRICLEKMQPTLLLRSCSVDLQSHVGLVIVQRQLIHDRSTYRDIDTSVLGLLLEHNASVNQLDESGDTVLLNAVEYGLIKHVEKLLAHGADARIQDRNSRSSLDIAGEHGFVDIINVLVGSCPSLLETVGEKTLIMATRHEFVGILETLYDKAQRCLSDDELGARLLLVATEYNSTSCAKFLLKRGIPLDWTNSKGETVVQVACNSGRTEILEILLQQGTKTPTSVDRSEIARTVVTLDHPLIKMGVIQAGQNDSITTLHQSQTYGFPEYDSMANVSIMEMLIRHGASFNFPTRQSRDSVASMLASLLSLVAPPAVFKLLIDLANSGSFRHQQLHHIILALAWQNHTGEALLLTLLILFSPRTVDAKQALTVFGPWLLEYNTNLVTQKLFTDALKL